MGQYASASIVIEFNDEEKASEFAGIAKNFNEELSKRRIKEGLDTNFHTNVISVGCQETCVEIELDSSRQQNTEWQCDQLSHIARTEFEGFVETFDATINTPYGYIYWDIED